MSLYWLLLVGVLFFSCGGGNYQEIKYHDDGSKSIVTDYESGKKIRTTAYYRDGVVRYERTYVDGREQMNHADMISYHPNGRIEGKYSTRAGIGNIGLSLGYWENGNLKRERLYKNGNYVTNKTYYEDGTKKELEFYTPVLNDGSGFYVSCKDSTQSYYYPNGQLERIENYRANKDEYLGWDVKHGEFKWWYDNGQIRTEGQYNNGRADGKWVWYRNILSVGTLKPIIDKIEYYKNGEVVPQKKD